MLGPLRVNQDRLQVRNLSCDELISLTSILENSICILPVKRLDTARLDDLGELA